jgi:hypothetical protein
MIDAFAGEDALCDGLGGGVDEAERLTRLRGDDGGKETVGTIRDDGGKKYIGHVDLRGGGWTDGELGSG